MLDKGTILRHYKKEDIQKEMILHALDKEIAFKYNDKGFGKRPDILKYPRDILELAKQGVSSFHASEELWINPLHISTSLKRQELIELRKGWDLVIDIDCPHWIYSKIIADFIVKALKYHKISAVSVKFSGNKGFHIGVPFEAFPRIIAGEDVAKRFPDDIKEIALYLKDMIKPIFLKKIIELEKGDINKIACNLGKEVSKITNGKFLDPDKMIDIDTILISSRHLYRMPYSLHEKSGLVSIPIHPDKVLEFEKEMAHPDKIQINEKLRFLDRANIIPDQAKELFDRSVAIRVNRESDKPKEKEIKHQEIPEFAIPEELFPPCVHNIFKGIEDGRQRSLFLLINFLRSCGWAYDDIEKRLKLWNKNNPEPLREVSLKGQIRYHKQQKKKILPPNCANSMYYKDFGVCNPDQLCQKIKNPVQYSKRKSFYMNNKKKGKKSSSKKP